MKTLTRPSDAPSTTSRTRLRQLCAAAVVVPALALTACSGESPVTADPTAPATSASDRPRRPRPRRRRRSPRPRRPPRRRHRRPPSSGRPTRTSTRSSRTPTSATRSPRPASPATSSGRRVSPSAPSSSRSSACACASSRARATPRPSSPSMLSLVASNPKQTVAPTNEFKGLWSAKELTKANRDETTSGWVFFKVNRGTTLGPAAGLQPAGLRGQHDRQEPPGQDLHGRAVEVGPSKTRLRAREPQGLRVRGSRRRAPAR